MRILVLGGIRSGKSQFAEQLATQASVATGDSVRYLATATPELAAHDSAWAARVSRHRTRRPAEWTTVETASIATALVDEQVTTLVDDLGSWVSSLIDSAAAWDATEFSLTEPLVELTSAITAFAGDLIIVSPEVGLSLVAPTPAGRKFQDELGTVNAAIAAVCDEVYLVVAGVPQKIKSAAAPITPPMLTKISPAQLISQLDTSDLSATILEISSKTADYATYIDPTDFGMLLPPDREFANKARERQLTLTKPAGSLGRLEELAIWVSGCQSACPPKPFSAPAVVIFAGDHGVAKHGVSAYPPEVTAQMVGNFINGGAVANVLSQQHGMTVSVYDLAVDSEIDVFPTHVSAYKVRRSSGDLRTEDSLTESEALQALAAGRAIADAHIDAGADLLIAGEMGIGNTTPATIMTALLTGLEPVVAVGRGTGIDDAGWSRKTAAVRDGMRRAWTVKRDPLPLLQKIAGADLTAMAGFLAQAAVRKTPVLLDGMVVTASALVADELAPGAKDWWIAGHRSVEPSHTAALNHLDLKPIIDLGMRLGEGSGALVAFPILQSAVLTLAHTATFTDAGVSSGDEL